MPLFIGRSFGELQILKKKRLRTDIFIGQGFAELQILKSENGPISRTVQNIVMKCCKHIDIDKM